MEKKKGKRTRVTTLSKDNKSAKVRISNGMVSIPAAWRNELFFPKSGEIKAERRGNTIVLSYDRVMCVSCEQPYQRDQVTTIGDKGKAICKQCLQEVMKATGDSPSA